MMCSTPPLLRLAPWLPRCHSVWLRLLMTYATNCAMPQLQLVSRTVNPAIFCHRTTASDACWGVLSPANPHLPPVESLVNYWHLRCRACKSINL